MRLVLSKNCEESCSNMFKFVSMVARIVLSGGRENIVYHSEQDNGLTIQIQPRMKHHRAFLLSVF